MKTKAVAKTMVATAIAVLMVACGGGGGDGGDSGTPAGTETGVFTDGPVGGVEYTTSGGHEGTTSADGEFNFNPGETVTFSIGATTLGTATATATVTPIDLAGTGADAGNKVTNMLVLLQSLDADGDASNGITITPATITAAEDAAALDLAAAPATFSGSTVLGTLMTASGTPKTEPVPVADAHEHFRHEFFSQARGGWVLRVGQEVIVLRVEQNGDYAIGEIAPTEGDGHMGIETGRMGWDAATGQISATVAVDTNGDWGLSDVIPGETAHMVGDQLVIRSPGDEDVAFSRIENDPDSLVGMWSLGSPTDVGKQTFVFGSAGTYMMIDPVGDEEGNCPVLRGLEAGAYTFTNGVLAVTEAPRHDQNGCAGLWDKPAGTGAQIPLQFNADKTTFTVDGTTFYRISR